MTSTEQRIAQAVDRTQTGWSIFMVILAIASFIFLPLLALLLLIPIGVITYYGSLAIMAVHLTKELNKDTWAEHQINVAKLNELHARLEAGDIQPGEELVQLMRDAGLTEIAPVMEIGPQIGMVGDHKMYDWVTLTDPDTETTQRFEYFGPAEFDEDGVLNGAELGKVYTIVDGIAYVKDAEPAQSDAK